jgi:precorrin-2 dehydrogenase/sirohydrochlorin ferrochelatase
MRAALVSRPYAVNLDLTGRPVLVVGGGPVAARKVRGLLSAGAAVTVVAPEAVIEIADDPDVRWFRRRYQRGEVASYRLGITATDDPDVNALVASDGDAAGIFVNSADDPANCSFTLPAVARQGDLQVAISTGGRSPGLARWLRRRYERELSAGYDQLLDLLAETRAEAREVLGTSEIDGWDDALDADLLGLVRSGRIEDARAVLRGSLGLTASDAQPEVAS